MEEALAILADLESKDKNDTCVTTQAIRMINGIHDAKKNTPSWGGILRGQGGSTTRRVLLGMAVQAMQQLSGVAVTFYFLPIILTRMLDISIHVARLLTACNATAFLLSCITAIYFTPRYGRRRQMICQPPLFTYPKQNKR